MKIEEKVIDRIKKYIVLGGKGTVIKRLNFDLKNNYHWNYYTENELNQAFQELRNNGLKVEKRGTNITITFLKNEETTKYLADVKVFS